jgi:hypothetical protein
MDVQGLTVTGGPVPLPVKKPPGKGRNVWEKLDPTALARLWAPATLAFAGLKR